MYTHSYNYTIPVQEQFKITDLYFIRGLGNSVFTWFSSKQQAGSQCHRIKPKARKWHAVLGFIYGVSEMPREYVAVTHKCLK